jgi:TonB-linked SusC/RagA family outer membrane protein
MRKLTLLLLGIMCIALSSQAQRTVTGKVTDDQGKPLPTVSVLVKGTTSGTTTNADGNYSLLVPANAKALVFSFVNFESVEMSLGSKSTINVSMTTTEKALTEVVVTGYTREKKREFTGAATVLQPKIIENVPVAGVDQMLQGRVPGIVANSSSGQPGASANVHIRGISSIQAAGVQPLYVVDGVPIPSGDLSTLNPNDFESVTILKDAGAAALYGSRGSLGVIVITTKRGKAGAVNFQFRSQVGFTQRPQPSQFDQMNAKEMLKYEEFVGGFAPGLTAPGWVFSANNPANAALPATSPVSNPYAASKARYAFLLDSLGSITTNYYDLLFRTGVSQTHEINMNGGNAATRYFFSFNYFNQDGTDRKSNLKRYAARFNIDNQIGKLNLAFNSGIAYSRTNWNEGSFYAGNGTANPFAMVWRAKPYENPYRADGTLIFGASTATVPKAIGNLIERSNNSTWIEKQMKVNAGLTLAFKPVSFLTLKNTTGVDGAMFYAQGAIDPNSYVGSLQTYQAGFLNESNLNRLQLINTTAALYNERFGAHNVEVGAFFEAVRQWTNGMGLTLYNLDPRLFQTGQGAGALTTGGAATVAQNGGSAKSGYGIRSYFATAKYNFDNKYTISGNIRRDGTSRIYLPENKEFTTWSAGATWDVIKESFMETQNVLTDLRLRFTYGKVPNINSIPGGGAFGIGSSFYSITNYLGAQQPAFTATSYAGSAISGQVPGVANPNLKMETVAKTNIGIDLGFWRNRVRLTADFYKSLTENLFISQKLVATSGFYQGDLIVNAGTMSNKGVELDLTVDLVRTRDWDVTFKANHALNINKIEDLGQVNQYTSGTGIIKEGLPYGAHYSYWYLGADPATGRPMYKKPDGTTTTNIAEAGQFHEFGSWYPKHVGGVSLEARFKRITVGAFFSYQFDVMRYNNIQNWVTQGDATYTGAVNQSRVNLTDQWQKPGDVKSIQSPAFSRQFTSYDITDAKFLRFRNLSIAYNIPELNVGGLKLIKSAKFYIQGQNLWIWSPWSGLDPEDDNNISLSEFPNPRAVVVGIDINF